MNVAVNVVDTGYVPPVVLSLYIDRMRVRYVVMRPRRKHVLGWDQPTASLLFDGWPDYFLPRLCGDQLGDFFRFGRLVHSALSYAGAVPLALASD